MYRIDFWGVTELQFLAWCNFQESVWLQCGFQDAPGFFSVTEEQTRVQMLS